MHLLTPVSPGELLDKLTILDIKSARITDQAKLANVRIEHELLNQVWQQSGLDNEAVQALRAELRKVNESLWQIEDDIRACERQKDFGQRFVGLARAVYITNDQRAEIKKKINLELGSVLVEEKSYGSD
jgi:post-segregation antitoxin (ccd killing protein)